MERVVIFPGSFDPFTRGHQAVVDEALMLFDKVIIAIGYNVAKPGFIPVEHRKKVITQLYANSPRVECHTYDCLTGEFAASVGAVAMVRGLRNTLDFEQERILDGVNRRLYPQLKTITLFTPAELAHVSSSAVRELLRFGKDVSELLPQGVNIDEYLNLKK